MVGRNPTPPSLRRGWLYGFPQTHGQGAPKRSDGGRSGESRICERRHDGLMTVTVTIFSSAIVICNWLFVSGDGAFDPTLRRIGWHEEGILILAMERGKINQQTVQIGHGQTDSLNLRTLC
jgi:hypothetical protein